MEKLTFPYLPITYFFVTIAACIYAIIDSGFNIHRIIGLVLIISAYLLWILARLQLGKAFSLKPHAKFLVTTGLYRKLRHPIYVFSVIVLIGLTVFFWNRIALLATVLVTILEIWRRDKEENVLAEKFGQQYEIYKKTSWF